MERKQFIVIGMGRFGQSVARTLTSMGKEVLAVDKDEEHVNDIAPHVTHAVQADATDEKALNALGLRNFDVALVTIGDDIQSSILVTLLCKEMGVHHVVAKAQTELHAKVLLKIGADRVIFPERDMGVRLAHNLAAANVIDYIQVSDELRVLEIGVTPSWAGKSLIDLDFRKKYGVNVIAIKNSAGKINTTPRGGDILNSDDLLIVVGQADEIGRIEKVADK
jgi:trk system potassium uptake protein TrkA